MDTAARFATEFDRACDLAAKQARIGASAAECAPDLRLFAEWNYTVFNWPINDGIDLIRILHGARDIPQVL